MEMFVDHMIIESVASLRGQSTSTEISLDSILFNYIIVTFQNKTPSVHPEPLEHSRDLSSSLAACAARSSPVGSKLLHLSLGLSPPPLEPPAGGGGGGG